MSKQETREENRKRISRESTRRCRTRRKLEKLEDEKNASIKKETYKTIKAHKKRLQEIEIANEAANRELARHFNYKKRKQIDAEPNMKEVDLKALRETSKLINAEYIRYKNKLVLNSKEIINENEDSQDCDIKKYSCSCDLSGMFLVNDS